MTVLWLVYKLILMILLVIIGPPILVLAVFLACRSPKKKGKRDGSNR